MSRVAFSNGMPSQFSILAFALATSFMLAGCGGGGGDDDSSVSTVPPTIVNPLPPPTIVPNPPPVYPPEGMWVGTTDTGRSVYGFVLNTTQYWVLYSSQFNADVIAGAIQGTSTVIPGPIVGTSATGDFTSSDAKDFNLEGAGILDASVLASYVERTSFNGSVTYTTPPSSATFASTYDKRWELIPTLASLAGSFTGASAVLGGSEPTTLTITSTGSISGSGASGCTFSGTAAPHVRGNVFDVSITFGGGVCSNGTDTVTGIGFYDIATKRLWGTALNSTRTNGFIFAGSKP